jgi:toxin ParE1/3/4
LKTALVTELARSDLDKIWDYIAQDNPTAADRLMDRIEVQCQRLADAPQLGRPRPQHAAGLYSYRVRNYLIFYFVNATGIEIARVLHGARDLPKIF